VRNLARARRTMPLHIRGEEWNIADVVSPVCQDCTEASQASDTRPVARYITFRRAEHLHST
jgi:hypothetical protein